jgi:DNA-binding NarL/FixJ family response regulator
MAVMDGLAMTEQLVALIPDIKIIILTMHSKAAFVEKAQQAGAKGFVLKHAEMEELYEAFRMVHGGKDYNLNG